MPLTAKGNKIMANMAKEYGPEKGERVFYASRNAGKISGVDRAKKADGGEVDETYPAGEGKLDWVQKYKPRKRNVSAQGDRSFRKRNVKSMANTVADITGEEPAPRGPKEFGDVLATRRGGRTHVGKAMGGATKKRADR